MTTIKNSKELKKLLNKNKDLIFPDEDIRIEYQIEKGELRNVECMDLFLMNDEERFDFTGGNFTGWDFTGRDFTGGDFTGEDFNGWNFNGRDFTGWNFTGWNFTGKKISYYAFFNCTGKIKCTEIKGRREPCAEPVSLEGKIEIIK